MTAFSLHPTPTPRAVVREQIRTVGLALRKEGMLFLIFLAAIAILALTVTLQNNWSALMHGHYQTLHQTNGGRATYTLNSDYTLDGMFSVLLIPLGIIGLLLPFGLAGVLVPFGVWRSEDPSRRSYHWTMPIARGPHTLIKVLSGWLWLMATVVVYLAFVFGLGILIRQILIMSGHMMKFPMPIPSWRWAIPFTTTTLVYLCTSIAVISSNRPWRWIGSLIVMYIVAISCCALLDSSGMVHTLGSLVTGTYGLITALFGGFPHPDSSHIFQSAMTTPSAPITECMQWLRAIGLWITVSGIGVCIAAYRRGNPHAT